jgi:hypothetical protein
MECVMKKIFIVLLAITLLAALPLTGCKSLVKGSGTLKTRDFFLTDFSEVKADDAFEVKIIYSTSYNITVTADDNLLDHVQVSRKGETLKLSLNRADYVDTSVKAVITMPHLHKLSLSGNTKGSIANFNTRAGINFNLSGDSSLSSANMTVGDITLDLSEASKVTGNLTAGDIHLKAENGSTVQLGGSANDLTCEAGDSSLLKLEAFTVRNCNIKMSGQSTATLKLDGKLDVDLKKASKLIYYGDPVLSTTQISGGSTMTRK